MSLSKLPTLSCPHRNLPVTIKHGTVQGKDKEAMSSYANVKSHKLTFKGDAEKKKKKKKRRREHENGGNSVDDNGLPDTADTSEDGLGEEEITIVTGTGRITSSGCTIYGHATQFSNELSVGDAIIVTHPSSLADETKIVTLVLSNVSMSVSSTFSTDLISTSSFRYVKAPKAAEREETEEDKKLKKRMVARESEEAAFGIYAGNGGETFTYRTKNAGAAGTYTIVTEKNSKKKTREEMLEMRSKKKADRFCY